jgi:hypothetical protein
MWCRNDLEDVILNCKPRFKILKTPCMLFQTLIIMNPFLTIKIVTMQLVFGKSHIFNVQPLVSNDSIFVSHYIRIKWLDPFSDIYKKITENAL